MSLLSSRRSLPPAAIASATYRSPTISCILFIFGSKEKPPGREPRRLLVSRVSRTLLLRGERKHPWARKYS
jgi:hypothetical protein